jgi:hypothetical protein
LAILSSLPVRTSRYSRSFSIDDHRAQPPSTGQTRCQTLFAHPVSPPRERARDLGSSARTLCAAAGYPTGGPRTLRWD